MTLLDVNRLSSRADTKDSGVEAVNNVDLSINHGETVRLVGESGGEKSVTAISVMGLVNSPEKLWGSVIWNDEGLLSTSNSRLENIRDDVLSIILQDSMGSLHLVHRPEIRFWKRSHDVIKGKEQTTSNLKSYCSFEQKRMASKAISGLSLALSGFLRMNLMWISSRTAGN
jgi:ABC-type microcin C transport system duplicated ATPase subunit YejF